MQHDDKTASTSKIARAYANGCIDVLDAAFYRNDALHLVVSIRADQVDDLTSDAQRATFLLRVNAIDGRLLASTKASDIADDIADDGGDGVGGGKSRTLACFVILQKPLSVGDRCDLLVAASGGRPLALLFERDYEIARWLTFGEAADIGDEATASIASPTAMVAAPLLTPTPVKARTPPDDESLNRPQSSSPPPLMSGALEETPGVAPLSRLKRRHTSIADTSYAASSLSLASASSLHRRVKRLARSSIGGGACGIIGDLHLFSPIDGSDDDDDNRRYRVRERQRNS